MTATDPGTERSVSTSGGLGYALLANATWATQTLYWPMVDDSGPVELLAHRIVWSTVICAGIALAVPRLRADLAALCRSGRDLRLQAGAGGVLAVAWGVYIFAVNSGHVVEGSLGLFMVPLSTVVCGVLVFGERLRRAQWVAASVAGAATFVLSVAYGRFPWIAVTLCVLMAVYATLKKRAAAPALAGFTVECLAVAPLALVYLTVVTATGRDTVEGGIGVALVACSGLITAVPLLAHAAALRRLPLTTVGIVQYVNPTGQFLVGVLVRHEPMSAWRWLGFALVWTAVLVFVTDGTRRSSHAG